MSEQTRTDNCQEVMTASKDVLPEHVVDFIEQCRAKEHSESQLISVLHKVQDHFGYLAPDTLDAVAQLLQVPAATVSGVATFYHFFRLTPRGRYVISVCMGTACYVKGAERVVDKFKDELGIDFGETTTDGMFSLEESRCLGTCGLAPVVMINDHVHGKVTPDEVPILIESHRKKPAPTE